MQNGDRYDLCPVERRSAGGVEPGEAVLVYLQAELLLNLLFCLGTEFQGYDLGGPRPYAVGDVVARDVENLPVLGDTSD